MKALYLVGFFLLSGCNWGQKIGLGYVCSDSGVEYIISTYSMAPHLKRDGSPVPCGGIVVRVEAP